MEEKGYISGYSSQVEGYLEHIYKFCIGYIRAVTVRDANCWFHRLRNVVSSNKGIFLINDDQEAGIASKTDGG
jgi:hypothetical protein